MLPPDEPLPAEPPDVPPLDEPADELAVDALDPPDVEPDDSLEPAAAFFSPPDFSDFSPPPDLSAVPPAGAVLVAAARESVR